MRKTSLLGAAVCVLALSGLSTSPAFAAGQVERGPAHANSICSFSGLNDTPDAAAPEGGRVQSYGQIVRLGLKAEAGSPGMLCNGHLFPFPEAFPSEGP
ncbi:hypothetical protein PTW37_08935 [Arthrobacter agilis]|uniref:hypothetical protein n=1 Tax=Arthrobacter agilis TaxID=37921 RepID=UPI002366CF94|nr:hypothetical protein [Arthrobacter agilis]WDF32016.1 hypothetical protein PTW37_08935 [Arthrobacter agilis]